MSIFEDSEECQPDPIKNDLPASWDLVLNDLAMAKHSHPEQERMQKLLIEDIKKRDLLGEKRYGVRLQPCNGRNTLQDAYEECLDAIVYMRSAVFEEFNSNTLVVTPETEFFKAGTTQLYTHILDVSMKLKFLIEKKKEHNGSKEENSIILG